MRTFLSIACATFVLFVSGATAIAQGAGTGTGAGAGGANAGSAGSAGAGDGGSYSPGDGSHDGQSRGITGTEAATVTASSATTATKPLQDRDRIQDPTTHTGDEPLQDRDQDRDRLTSTTSPSGSGTSSPAGQGATNQFREGYRLMIDPEHLQIRARSGNDLTEMLQVRERELAQEVASTTPGNRMALQNATPVRLAVFALLASQDMFGNLGPQVAQIATQMHAQAEDVANAEVQTQSRGFFARLLFGGDAQAGSLIAQAVEQNKASVQNLQQLIAQASTTAQVRDQLQSQLQTVLQEQTRLSELAAHEQNSWGLFSWRF